MKKNNRNIALLTSNGRELKIKSMDGNRDWSDSQNIGGKRFGFQVLSLLENFQSSACWILLQVTGPCVPSVPVKKSYTYFTVMYD